jgi:transcription initiation factor TFIIIB Brf1 subunit/transcription initiation factor TFIIB
LVLNSQQIDRGRDWSTFDDGEAQRAEPIDRTRNDDGFDTRVGFEGRPQTQRHRQLLRAKRFERSRESKKHRKQGYLLSDIKQAAAALDLSDPVADNACVLFKQFHNEGDHIGFDLDEMAAAAVYTAARAGEEPLLIDDVVEQFDLAGRRRLVQEFQRLQQHLSVQIPIKTPGMLVPRFVSELEGSPKTETLARGLAREVEAAGLTVGKTTGGVASAIVYLAFSESVVDPKQSQSAVATVANTSTETLRRHRDRIKEHGITADNIGQ